MTPPPARTASTADLHRVVDAVWRMESARIVGALARVTGDVGLAEELAQDALVAALEQWPASGVPATPGAWLMATAKHRAIDTFRRSQNLQRKTVDLGRELVRAEGAEEDWAAALDEVVEDDVLRLVFIACHPVLSREARVALTLRLVGGLTTDEIARAFLVPEPTLAQRIVRAKRTLRAARVAVEMPAGADFTARLASVLEVLYLIFNEGYAATAGTALTRPALCQEAMRLGRILAGLVPGESEVHGLVALMELQASRLAARTGPDGGSVLLPTRTATGGTACWSLAGWPPWTEPSGPRPAASAGTRCRQRSRPATLAPAASTRPAGPRSPGCTRRSRH